MKIDEANARMWSRIGSRAAFGLATLELGEKIENLLILTADTSTSAGLDRFKKKFPGKFLDVGIAEQNMIGIAAGLASEGVQVITATFGPFQTMRCCEQIKVNLGYMRQKVCMVGLASGVVLGTLGYTHCCIEDLSIMRSIPGITVISPADCGETVKATMAAIEHNESVYIRLTGGMNNPIVYTDDYEFQVGKAVTLRQGNDVTIIATGTMVSTSLEVAEILETVGISSEIVNMHTLKPIDTVVIEKACELSKLIVTIEEHSIIGGLGSAVAEYKTKLSTVTPQMVIGLPDRYGKAGEYKDMLKEHGLTASHISENIISEYQRFN